MFIVTPTVKRLRMPSLCQGTDPKDDLSYPWIRIFPLSLGSLVAGNPVIWKLEKLHILFLRVLYSSSPIYHLPQDPILNTEVPTLPDPEG